MTVTESSAKTPDLASLDTLTGGAFTAPTSGDRAARLRDWLQTEPSVEQLQHVAHEMSVRDRGAAKAVRERLDELRRLKEQDALIQTWAEKGQALCEAPRIQIGDALAWQRDAAKAGAPLSREPLASLKTALADRVKAIEDLQHQAQVQREAAVLLAQRVEVLSTKAWQDALAQRDAVQTDMQRWQEQVDGLTANAQWSSVDLKFTPALQASAQQLQAVWQAFDAALVLTQTAAADPQAALPAVPAWADQIRVARGELLAQVVAAKAEVAQLDSSRTLKPKANQADIDAKRLALCEQAAALFKPVAATPATPATPAAQPVTQAESPTEVSTDTQIETPAVPAPTQLEPVVTGRKLQEQLRQLRESWKKIDKEAAPNPALWKRFDTACSRAHGVVDAWLKELRAQSSAAKAERLALIDEVLAWTASVGQGPDWKRAARELHAFSQRWREGGHLSEKLFAELQAKWKAAIHAAHEPLEAAQKASMDRRKALIEEAHTLAAEPRLRIDAVKVLQQRWQEEAHSVALDRRQEQKMWEAFRQPIDEAFTRSKAAAPRGARTPRDTRPGAEVPANLSAHDQAVLAAAQALEAAIAGGEAAQIHAAMSALEQATRGQAVAEASVAPPPPEATPPAAEPADEAHADALSDAPAASPAAPTKPARPLVAVRGDDRPGQKRTEPAPSGFARARDGARPGGPAGARAGGRDAGRDARQAPRGQTRDDRAPRGPRLADAAFRAQRHAMENAQAALRKLAAQAHGEVLTQLMQAWQVRDAAAMPTAQALGKAASSQRAQWAQALQSEARGDGAQALLRLEVAADLPTPAAHLQDRRALQLQLLTRRNDPTPDQTWGTDVAQVLAGAHDEAHARRLQAALKVLLKR